MSTATVIKSILRARQPDVLPSSRLKDSKHVIMGWHPLVKAVIPWVHIYCANCGFDSGMIVPEVSCDFAFYLCDERGQNCAARWEPLAQTMLIPDEVFWLKLREVQMEEFGRELTEPELVEALKDDGHVLSKLAKERSS